MNSLKLDGRRYLALIRSIHAQTLCTFSLHTFHSGHSIDDARIERGFHPLLSSPLLRVDSPLFSPLHSSHSTSTCRPAQRSVSLCHPLSFPPLLSHVIHCHYSSSIHADCPSPSLHKQRSLYPASSSFLIPRSEPTSSIRQATMDLEITVLTKQSLLKHISKIHDSANLAIQEAEKYTLTDNGWIDRIAQLEINKINGDSPLLSVFA